MKELHKLANWLLYSSLICLIFAIYGAFVGNDLWLAPTQWLIVSTSLVAYAVFLKVN